MDIPLLNGEMGNEIKRKIPFELRKFPNRLVKHNIWYDHILPFFQKNYTTINLVEIKLVPYEEQDKPVVRHEQVFQICVRDWDNDCILKDDINGVEIIKDAFNGDELYDNEIFEYIPEHPVNTIFQIKYRDTILSGNTLELQLLVDLYYSNFYYI